VIRAANSVQHQDRRASLSEEQSHVIRAADSVQHQDRRANLSQEQSHVIRAANSVQHQDRRASLSLAAAQGDEDAMAGVRTTHLQDAAQHRAVNARRQVPRYERDVNVMLEYYHASTEQLPLTTGEGDNTDHLDPISEATKNAAIQDYNVEMNPRQLIYGCFSCGVWVRMPGGVPLKRKLKHLQILRSSAQQIAEYDQFPNR
jgi:hypothetical protein